MKSKSVVLMVVSLGFGLIAAIGISQVMGNNNKVEPTVERGQVLVAASNLKHGDDLTEENVKIEHWPLEVIPEEAIRSFDQIKHMKISTRLSKSLPIMMSDVANPKDISKVEIPPGFKLVAIKVSAEETLNGLLQPGDKVDVIGVVTVRNDDPNVKTGKTKTISETFLKNIEVYAVDGRLSNASRREDNISAKNAIIGVLVTEKQSELIVLVQKVAKLRLVLRGDYEEEGDWDEFTDYSQFYDSVFGKEAVTSDEDSVSPELHITRVYEAEGIREVAFHGNRRVTPAVDGSFEESLNDSEDYERSEESDSDQEEDHYRGE